MSKDNRSVRPRLFSSLPSALELARKFTGLNRRDIRRLSQALARCSDLDGLLRQLPLRAVEPFIIAAFLSGRPIKLEKVVSLLPRLDDPFSVIRVVSATSGDRIGTLLDLVQSESMVPFLRASLLYLCVDLLEGERATARLVESLRHACQTRNSWMSWVLLRDIAVRLETTELLRLTRPAAPVLQTPAGRLMVSRLRHLVFQPPLVGLPEAELFDLPEYEVLEDLGQTDDDPESEVQRLTVPLHLLEELNFQTIESRALLLTHQILARAEMWESAERALDELMRRGVDDSYREKFVQLLIENGQIALAERQATRTDEQELDEPWWMRHAA
jgi:hypothetical protein